MFISVTKVDTDTWKIHTNIADYPGEKGMKLFAHSEANLAFMLGQLARKAEWEAKVTEHLYLTVPAEDGFQIWTLADIFGGCSTHIWPKRTGAIFEVLPLV